MSSVQFLNEWFLWIGWFKNRIELVQKTSLYYIYIYVYINQWPNTPKCLKHNTECFCVNFMEWSEGVPPKSETMPSLGLIRGVQVFLRGKRWGSGTCRWTPWAAEKPMIKEHTDTHESQWALGKGCRSLSPLSLFDSVFLLLISIGAEE